MVSHRIILATVFMNFSLFVLWLLQIMKLLVAEFAICCWYFFFHKSYIAYSLQTTSLCLKVSGGGSNHNCNLYSKHCPFLFSPATFWELILSLSSSARGVSYSIGHDKASLNSRKSGAKATVVAHLCYFFSMSGQFQDPDKKRWTIYSKFLYTTVGGGGTW
jgi:hypothetical protein